jgi:hypothetical protein
MSLPAAKLPAFPRMWAKTAIKTTSSGLTLDYKLFLKSAHALSVDVTSCSFNQLANNYWILRGASIRRHINLTYAYVTPQQISVFGVWRHITIIKHTAVNIKYDSMLV